MNSDPDAVASAAQWTIVPRLLFSEARFQIAMGEIEASLKADREHDAGLARRVDCPFGASPVQGERLFDIDVLAGGGGPQNLILMLAVRRRRHDRVDAGIGQQRSHILVQRDAPAAAELRRLCRASRLRCDELNVAAFTVNRVDQRFAPPSEADNSSANHENLFAAKQLRASGRRTRDYLTNIAVALPTPSNSATIC